jgi:hypothetical protein
MLNLINIIIPLIISILFTIFNGLIINWKLSNNSDVSSKISKKWHKVGFFIHVLIVIQLFLLGGWTWSVIGFFVVWIIHNIIIAIQMGQKWYYVGKTAWFDIQIRKIFKNINFDK